MAFNANNFGGKMHLWREDYKLAPFCLSWIFLGRFFYLWFIHKWCQPNFRVFQPLPSACHPILVLKSTQNYYLCYPLPPPLGWCHLWMIPSLLLDGPFTTMLKTFHDVWILQDLLIFFTHSPPYLKLKVQLYIQISNIFW